MAEFCLKCFNEINGTHYTRADVIEHYDICEGCAEYKKCVIDLRGYGLVDLFIRFYINLTQKDMNE